MSNSLDYSATKGLAIAIAASLAILASWAAKVASADSTPALSESSTGTLKQECVESGLVKPKVTRSVMKHPGHRRGRTQEISVDAEFLAMPSECEGHFERHVGFRSRINGRSYHPQEGLYYSNDAGIGKGVESPSGHEAKAYFVHCYPKPAVAVLVAIRVVRAKPIKVPVKGQPGLYSEIYPVVARKLMRKPVQVRC